MDEAERLCDRVAIIDGGRIVAQGAPAELVKPLAADAAVRFTATTGFDATWLQEVAGVARLIRDDQQIVVHGTGPSWPGWPRRWPSARWTWPTSGPSRGPGGCLPGRHRPPAP